MDLRTQLKEETKSLHNKIEQTNLLKKIIQNELTPNDYQRLIKKFHGFITPCEDLISTLKCKSIIENRKKKPWLDQDLCALKISTLDDTTPQKCLELPVLLDYEHVLGYLYVIEGATLGGQIISKMLKTQLQITKDQGGRFFYGYGNETKKMWDEYCSLLHNISNAEHKSKIIASARNTYNLLHNWMEEESI